MSAAYNALVQAQYRNTPYTFMQDAKLVRAAGDGTRALRELDQSIRLAEEAAAAVIDLTNEEVDKERKLIMAKAEVLRCHWAREVDNITEKQVVEYFNKAMSLSSRLVSFLYGALLIINDVAGMRARRSISPNTTMAWSSRSLQRNLVVSFLGDRSL